MVRTQFARAAPEDFPLAFTPAAPPGGERRPDPTGGAGGETFDDSTFPHFSAGSAFGGRDGALTLARVEGAIVTCPCARNRNG
jgi:hypothetical protein